MPSLNRRPSLAVVISLLVGASAGGADPTRDRNAVAAFLSAEYLDAAVVVREPVGGGKVMLKSPLPATSPRRTDVELKAMLSATDRELNELAQMGGRAFVRQREAVRQIDRILTAKRMDRAFIERVMKDFQDEKELKDALELLGVNGGQGVTDDIRDFLKGVVRPMFEVGLAQKLRADESERFEATVQGVWDSKLYARVEAAAGPAFGRPAVEVARTQFEVETGSGPAVVWRGLCATNLTAGTLTNVAVDVGMTGRGNERLRRTWFFPAMKPGQTFVLYVNDRAFGRGGHTDTTDVLAVEVRAACDQGKQPAQQYRLAKDGRGHLARGTVTPVSAEAASDDIRAAALFRTLAAKGKAVTFGGSDGKRDVRYELRFTEATEPLRNMANRPLVQPGQYLRVSLTDLSTKKVTELDGHPEGAFGKLVLLSHGALNAALEPQARRFDRNHGSLTVQGDKLVLQIHSATLTAAVADTGVPLDSLPKPKPGEGGVPRAPRQPKDGPKPETSLVGRWDVTFKNGATAVLAFETGGQFSGTNGSKGTWTQTGAKFRITTAAVNGGKELTWDGEIAADGKTLTATSSAGGTASGTRK